VEKSVDEQALIEIEEEIKLTKDDIELVRKGKPVGLLMRS